jgi:hypothetical protein
MANNSTQEEYLLSIPVPEKTETYSPVPHRVLINEVTEKLKNKGLDIVNKNYWSNNDGRQMIGTYGIESDDSDLHMMLAFRNSYDKSMAVGFAAGAQVMICSNGMITGDLVVYRKHTGDVLEEVHDYIIDGINMLEGNFKKLKADKDLLEIIPLNDRQQAEILGRLYVEKEIITSTQLNIVKHELVKSANFVGKNAWCLYNNVTEALKTSHVTNALQDHIELHEFFEEEVLTLQ